MCSDTKAAPCIVDDGESSAPANRCSLLLHPSPFLKIRTQQSGTPEHAQVSARIKSCRMFPRSVRDPSTVAEVVPVDTTAAYCSNGLAGFEKSDVCCEVRCNIPKCWCCVCSSLLLSRWH